MSEYKYNSILDIIGPEMIGPSSSHTAGAVRLGLAARSILNSELQSVQIELYNSFAETGIGHGTHKALLAGLLGLQKSDERIKIADKLVTEANIKYSIKRAIKANRYPPNTAIFKMRSRQWYIEVVGVSIGGGLILIREIDGFEVNITGDYETLIVTHKDILGILSRILHYISLQKLNIVSINSVRHNKLEDIKTIITFDNYIVPEICGILKKSEIGRHLVRARIIHKIQEVW